MDPVKEKKPYQTDWALANGDIRAELCCTFTKSGNPAQRIYGYKELIDQLTTWMECLCFRANSKDKKLCFWFEKQGLQNIRKFYNEGFEEFEEFMEDNHKYEEKYPLLISSVKNFEQQLRDYQDILEY
jgi:hypothetical protein